MTAFGATDDLGDELESAFFGGEIGESEAGIGLGDAESGEFGEIKAFCDYLSADNNVDIARADFVVGFMELFFVVGIGVKARDGCVGEEFFEFGLEEFGAKAFVMDIGVAAIGARGGDF